MGYWGWRPFLLFFVSAWIVSCSTSPDYIPPNSPTQYPPITLTVRPRATITPQFPLITPKTSMNIHWPTPEPLYVYTVRDGDTLEAIGHQFGLDAHTLRQTNPDLDTRPLRPGQQLRIPSPHSIAPYSTPTPIYLDASAPHCEYLASNTLVCLGTVINTQPVDVGRIYLQLDLWDAAGHRVAQASTFTVQDTVPTGAQAPYRMLFSPAPTVDVQLVLSMGLTRAAPDGWVVLHHDENGAAGIVNQHYEVTTSIHNPFDQRLESLRAVLTLYDTADQVSDFRVVDLAGPLSPGANRPLAIRVPVINQERVAGHRLHIEGRLVTQ